MDDLVNEPADPDDRPSRTLEELLDAALEAHAVGSSAVDRLLAEHPAHASEVRAHLAQLDRFGLLDLEPAASTAAVPGQLGGFRLIARLGEGGMGLVWIAEEVALGRRVALKMIRPEQLWFAGARGRFKREVEAVARLQHPGIVPVYAAGETEGVPYFTMELVDGCTLADVLRAVRGRDPRHLSGADLRQALDAAVGLRDRATGESSGHARGALFETSWIDACVAITRQVAEALDYAHGRGLVHRDVKPSNVALTRTGRAMLLDFGLARSDAVDRMTRSGSQPGSLPYMSPEQLAGAPDVDARTDVYSLGASLYELLTLQPAFSAESALDLQRRISSGEVARPRQIAPRIPRDVETVVLKAMAREPAQRYASADDFARDLGNLLARRPIEARRPGVMLRFVRWSQRHPKASAALVVAVPLVIVALGALAWIERTRSAEILRLSDVRRLADLDEEAGSLWPATPERVGAYERWLARADALATRLPVHRATLADLEGSTGGVRAADGTAVPAEDEARWQHDTLSRLIIGIERLVEPERGVAAGMRERLAFARTLEDRSRTGAEVRARWDEAVRSIADSNECPAYGGLILKPQLGLVPIGRDPATKLWEFTHLASGEPVDRDADGSLALTSKAGIVFVLLPGGRFSMGSIRDPNHPDHDPAAVAEEEPALEVELDPFFFGKHLMTIAQWGRATAGDPGDTLYPVADVNWVEARRVLGQLGLDLPTEAQWEYAARSGTSTPWWTGREKESLVGASNLLDQSVYRMYGDKAGSNYESFLDDGYEGPSPIDAMRPNLFGIHDVTGNLCQWCRDPYVKYENLPRAGDGERKGAKEADNRVIRGGSAGSNAVGARSANRTGPRSDTRIWVLGIRCMRSVDP